MAFARYVLLVLASLPLLSLALPTEERRQSIRKLPQSEVDAFNPYTFYASAAGCHPSTTRNWTCGANCDANPSFKPVNSGGNGASIQYWFVGYDPTLKTVIVSHQGTDASKILPILTDANIIRRELDDDIFPGVPSSVKVHSGFRESQADTAQVVLAAVRLALQQYGANKVVTTGWSLGAAIALLEALHLKLQLPSVDVSVIGYGAPQVGNQAWADYIDSKLAGKVTYISNHEDIVPILPGDFLGFHHTSGELHIKSDNSWVSCPGQDNPDEQCTAGEVKNIFDGDPNDHWGPYNGIRMGC